MFLKIFLWNMNLRMSGPKMPHFAEHTFVDGTIFQKFAELIFKIDINIALRN